MADKKPDRLMYGRKYEHLPDERALPKNAGPKDYTVLYRGAEDDSQDPPPYAHTYEGGDGSTMWKQKEHLGYARGGLVRGAKMEYAKGGPVMNRRSYSKKGR